MEQDAAPAGVGERCPAHSGGPGAPPVRYYGRTARSSLTEARFPASRRSKARLSARKSAPRAEGAANRPEKRGPGPEGERRGGAPRGVRASSEARGTPDGSARQRIGPKRARYVRRSALLPPRLFAARGDRTKGAPGALQTIRAAERGCLII
jgi:hypothetical protein